MSAEGDLREVKYFTWELSLGHKIPGEEAKLSGQLVLYERSCVVFMW